MRSCFRIKSMRQAMVSAHALKKLLSALAPLGVDPNEIARHCGWNRLGVDDPERRVALMHVHDFWEAAVAHSRRREITLLVAQQFAPADYGLLAFVAMSCANVGEGLRQVARYLPLYTDEPAIEISDDGSVRLCYRGAAPTRPGAHCSAETALAQVLHGMRAAAQAPLAPSFVRFAHPGPEDTSAYASFFGAPVRFGETVTEMTFARELLAMPLPKADAQLGAFLRRLADDALARYRPPGAESNDSLLTRLREMMAEELRKGVPEAESLARRLGMSTRTLRRKLIQEGATFRQILDDVRASLARSYVASGRLPLCEVAFLLGFSESSAFHRAFKRWTGVTPIEFRAQSAKP